MLYSVEYNKVETPSSFLNVRKYGVCYLYLSCVFCSPVFGKTNRITYCEWLRTELHYQSSDWLGTNSVGHSGHFAAHEYFRQESLKASWWINTRKEDVFMFYSYLLKYYGHYYTSMKRCSLNRKKQPHGSLYHKLISK